MLKLLSKLLFEMLRELGWKKETEEEPLWVLELLERLWLEMVGNEP